MSKGKYISRFYSLALGHENTFASTRTDGLISEGDATPSVMLNSLLYANNSSTVVITHFDNPHDGQLIHLINLGSDLSLMGTQLQLIDTTNLAKGDNITLVYSNSSWYEVNRAHSASMDKTTVVGREGFGTHLILTGTDPTPSVKNIKTIIFNSAATMTITDFDDAVDGQVLYCFNNRGAVSLTNAAGLLYAGNSGQALVIPTSGGCILMYGSGAWHALGNVLIGV